MAGQLADRGHVGGLLGVCEESEVLGDLPDEDLAILRGRGDDAIVEGVPVRVDVSGRVASGADGEREAVPVGVENGGSVASEQGDQVGQLALLVEGNDGKGATTARVPIDGEVLGIDLGEGRGSVSLASLGGEVDGRRSHGRVTYLDQVGIPGIAADAQVIIAKFLPRRLSKDVSWVLSVSFGAGARQEARSSPTILRRSYKSARHGLEFGSCKDEGVGWRKV